MITNNNFFKRSVLRIFIAKSTPESPNIADEKLNNSKHLLFPKVHNFLRIGLVPLMCISFSLQCFSFDNRRTLSNAGHFLLQGGMSEPLAGKSRDSHARDADEPRLGTFIDQQAGNADDPRSSLSTHLDLPRARLSICGRPVRILHRQNENVQQQSDLPNVTERSALPTLKPKSKINFIPRPGNHNFTSVSGRLLTPKKEEEESAGDANEYFKSYQERVADLAGGMLSRRNDSIESSLSDMGDLIGSSSSDAGDLTEFLPSDEIDLSGFSRSEGFDLERYPTKPHGSYYEKVEQAGLYDKSPRILKPVRGGLAQVMKAITGTR
ncbi:MAG: hypothetical protein LBQ43_00600 [Holosporales bacterium]|jgi:hypothetical protein|nr:hypothetical protein [Holosporales bacterium]